MGMQAEEESKVWIPEISDDRLNELVDRIRPVYCFKGQLQYIQPVDPRRVSYLWSPEPAEMADHLEAVVEIITYHSYGAPSFFKPSIAEVLAQIPEQHLNEVVAFEIVDQPSDADDLNTELEALNAGYHVASTRLYKKK